MSTEEKLQKASVPLKRGMELLSNLLSKDVPEELLAPIFALTKELSGVVNSTQEAVKVKVKKMVEERGATFSEAGSKALSLAGWRLEIRPTGGGYDEAKLHALLRGKGLKRLDFCDVEKVYTLNKDKLQQLIGAKEVTEKELASCMKTTGYSVQTPVFEKDEE